MNLLSQAFKTDEQPKCEHESYMAHICVCVKNTNGKVSYVDIKIITCGGDAVGYGT